MAEARSTDTFVVRIRRERSHDGAAASLVERWQVEHVQTGLKVYVHGLDDAMAVIRSSLSRNLRKSGDGPASESTP